MNRKKRINDILVKNISDFDILIEDKSQNHIGHGNFDGKNETHLSILLKSKCKQKHSRLEIHKKINQLLNNEFKNGLHSLEIKIIN